MHTQTQTRTPAWLRLMDCTIAAIAIVFLLVVVIGGCTPLTPPPPPTTQISAIDHQHPLVVEYYHWRGGYMTAVQVATIARTAGQLDAQAANDTEVWRATYELTQLQPRAALAKPHMDPRTWDMAEQEQRQVEASWKRLLPALK